MPIIYDSAPLCFPKDNDTIVRYMDLPKFLSLIQKKAMFFCRQDKLEDQFEGQTAARNYDWRLRALRKHNDEGFLTSKMTEEQLTEQISQQYEFEKKLKAIRLINCWNKKSQESAALWKIYSDNGKGIMIKSSVSQLKNALTECRAAIRITEVNYINFENTLMPDGNDFYLVSHKQDAYSYEDEVRIFHEITQGLDGMNYNWEKEKNSGGKYFEVDLEKLIEEVVVGPYCPSWQFELIQDVLRKYGINKELKRSSLTVLS